jgi:murein DD-endopeptidase MepM/ murein hydrolase activator NlpD
MAKKVVRDPAFHLSGERSEKLLSQTVLVRLVTRTPWRRCTAPAIGGGAFLLLNLVTIAQNPPSHDWGYPFCRPASVSQPTPAQPYIMSVFDHEHAHQHFYQPVGDLGDSHSQQGVVAYTGDVRRGCPQGSNYVDRQDNRCWSYSGHAGWDYSLGSEYGAPSDNGTSDLAPVFAAHPGQISYVGYEQPNFLDPRSLIVRLRETSSRFESEYVHLAAAYVSVGDAVTQGSILGAVGATGRMQYAHLHFGAKEFLEHDGVYPPLDEVWFPYFDPYGWDQDWTNGPSATPTFPDPWPFVFDGSNPTAIPPGPAAVSQGRRLLLPGAPDNALACPSRCSTGTIIVEDGDSPPSSPGSSGFTASGQWTSHSAGHGGTHLTAPATGSITSTATATWSFGAVSTGAVFVVEAYVPARHESSARGAHAARYTMNGSSVVSQWSTTDVGVRGRWVPLRYTKFPTGLAQVTLSNAAFVGDPAIGFHVDDLNLVVFADAMRIIRICNWETLPGD